MTLKFCPTIWIRIGPTRLLVAEGSGVQIAVTSNLSPERIYFPSNNIEFVGFFAILICFCNLLIYSAWTWVSNLWATFAAIKSVLSYLSERNLLIVLGDFNLPDISWSPSNNSLVSTPLSDHDFVDGLLEWSLQQVSFIRNSLNRQLDLVTVLDPSLVTVSGIDPLVVPEDWYHPTLELTICLPSVDTLSPLLSPTKSRCFRKCDFNKLNNMISQYNWKNLYNCLDIKSATVSVLNSFSVNVFLIVFLLS